MVCFWVGGRGLAKRVHSCVLVKIIHDHILTLLCCYSVEVIVVLIGDDNKVLTADEAVEELSNSEAQANLNNSGFIISDEFTAAGSYDNH